MKTRSTSPLRCLIASTRRNSVSAFINRRALIALSVGAGLFLALFSLFGNSVGNSAAQAKQKISDGPTGTLQKMIVENGSVTMDLDLNRLNGISSIAEDVVTLQFTVAANSFFSIFVFEDLLRGPEQGSMALVLQNSPVFGVNAPGYSSPVSLTESLKQAVIEKLPFDAAFDLSVREAGTGFTFFNIEGGEYDYDAKAQLLSIQGARLLLSKEFADALGRASDSGRVVGQISIGAAMQPVEITQLDENGDVKSAALPALNRPGVGTVPGPDVIVGELIGLVQSDNGSVGGRVGLALGTDACNKGTIDVDWFALPSNDHPFIPQNFYRMSGGADNTQQFEQIGQSWGKHAFTAASANTCGFGCNGIGGSHLGSGCSDAYGTGLNGNQNGIGSRAWVNPFTGNFPSGSTANDHSGHTHAPTDPTAHRILVNVDDLNTSLNPGAVYFAEAQYIVPHEYAWCQSHPGQCNMFNNASYERYTVNGINQPFTFTPVGSTVREQPAIMAWTGATVSQLQPDPGNDGIWFMGYKVTNPSAGVWHYEYALYNQNLDRGIQSFRVPVGPGVNISNPGFHAPPQHPGWAHDGTLGDAGYSSTPWNVTQDASSITWNTETFAQNQNANAIRFGTLYNFRFDADQPPNFTDATVGFFKAGSPMFVVIQAPGDVPAPTPTPTPSPTPVPTPTATPTPTPCGQYGIQQIGGSIVPGTMDIGNHGDDVTTTISLPFSYTLYGQTFTQITLDSNGKAHFPGGGSVFTNTCLPQSGATYSTYPYWDDQRTDANTGCAAFPGGTCGIFTSVSGTAPNRIFNIEWRTVYFSSPTQTANHELRLYEGQSRFDVIYGTVALGNSSATAGVQRDGTIFTQYFCNGSGGAATGGQSYTLEGCGTPTPTPPPTATPTATPTVTPTATPTATPPPTPTATPTATPSPPPTATPRPRPTPGPSVSPHPPPPRP
jgi:hypothetical protein